MPEPFIFITTSKIKEGKLDEYRTYTRKSVEIIHSNEPRLIAFSICINEGGTKATTCGKPNDQFLEIAKQFADSGASLNINPKTLSGFTRPIVG